MTEMRCESGEISGERCDDAADTALQFVPRQWRDEERTLGADCVCGAHHVNRVRVCSSCANWLLGQAEPGDPPERWIREAGEPCPACADAC